MKRFLLVLITTLFMVSNLPAKKWKIKRKDLKHLYMKESFYKMNPEFERTKWAFIHDFQKHAYNWEKLIKKHIEDYESWHLVSKKEKEFMKQELMNLVKYPNKIEEAKKAEKEALAKQKAEEQALALKREKEKLLQKAKETYPYLKNKNIIDGFVGNFASVEATIIYCGNLSNNEEITDVYVIPPTGGRKETDPRIIPPKLVNVHQYANQLPGMCVREDDSELWCETDWETANTLKEMLKSDANKTGIKFLRGNYMGAGTIDSKGYHPVK